LKHTSLFIAVAAEDPHLLPSYSDRPGLSKLVAVISFGERGLLVTTKVGKQEGKQQESQTPI
jgi:hypothetical protein